jgi:hypothetical protein
MTDQQARTIEAHFQIIEFDETVYDQPEAGPTLMRVQIRKRYDDASNAPKWWKCLLFRGIRVLDLLLPSGSRACSKAAGEPLSSCTVGWPRAPPKAPKPTNPPKP